MCSRVINSFLRINSTRTYYNSLPSFSPVCRSNGMMAVKVPYLLTPKLRTPTTTDASLHTSLKYSLGILLPFCATAGNCTSCRYMYMYMYNTICMCINHSSLMGKILLQSVCIYHAYVFIHMLVHVGVCK